MATFAISEELHTRLKEVCKNNKIQMSGIAEQVLRNWVEEAEAGKVKISIEKEEQNV